MFRDSSRNRTIVFVRALVNLATATYKKLAAAPTMLSLVAIGYATPDEAAKKNTVRYFFGSK